MFSDTAWKNIKLFVWIFLLVIFQTVMSRYIAIKGIIPDVVFVFIISFVVLEKKFSYCLSVSLICGLLIDLLSSRGIGANIIAYSYSALVCYAIGEHFFKERLLFAVPMVFIMTYLGELVFYVLNYSVFKGIGIFELSELIIVPTTLYNAVITFIIYPLVKKTVYKGNRGYVRVPDMRRR